MAIRFWEKPITSGLDLRPASQERIYARYSKSGQKIMRTEVLGPRCGGQFTAVVVLISHVVKLPFKYLY